LRARSTTWCRLVVLGLTLAAAWETFALRASGQTALSGAEPPPQTQGASVQSYEGLMVREIRVSGGRPAAQDKIWRLITQGEGQAYSREKVRETVRNLYGTGRYADVRMEAERTPDGAVILTLYLTPNYFVGAITVQGSPDRPTANQIINTTKLQLGEQLTLEKVTRAMERVRVLMEDNGFHKSQASYEELPHPETQQVDIRLTIEPGPRAHVGEVTATGSVKLSRDQLEDISGMHPGDLVTTERVTRSLERVRRRFQKEGRYTTEVSIVDRAYQPASNAVDYKFDIEPGPRVDVAVEGARISRRILKQRVPIFEEGAIDEDLLNEGRANLTDYMQTRGFFEAQVKVYKKQDPNGGQLHIIYDVDSGERHKMVKLTVSGNKYFLTDDLLSRMQVQTAGRLFSYGRYSQSLLSSDIKGLQDLYHASGFREIKITPDVKDDHEGKKNEISVHLNVEEGPQTLVGTLHFAGNNSIDEARLHDLITPEGQPYSEYNLANDRDQVLTEYLNHGFPDARLEIESKPLADKSNKMEVTYVIQEGERVVVDHVLVSGIEHTRKKVVDKELQVHPGDALSQASLYDTQKRLYDMGIFSQVDVALQDPEGREQDKNVLVNVHEGNRYTFNYGFGFEAQTGQPQQGATTSQGKTGVSPRISFDVTRLNFRGLNHTLVFKSNVGSLQQRGLVSYEAPRWLDNDRLRLIFTAFYDNTLSVTTFTSRRLEGSIQAEQILDRFLNPERHVQTLLYRLSYRQVKAEITAGFDPNLVPLLSQPARVGGPGFSYIRDKRNSPIESNKGDYFTLDFSWASGYFGSEADFSRVLLQHSSYYKIGKKGLVIARSTRFGLENTFRNTALAEANSPIPLPAGASVIPLPERLFAGGGNSHRGFSINQAGPRDLQSGQPLGGTSMFINNFELRFPPVKWPYVGDNMSFVLFHDLGNVFDTPAHLLKGLGHVREGNQEDCKSLTPTPGATCDFNYLVSAIGAGVHYKTPIGPVRLDFGYNMNPATFPVRTAPNATTPPHIESLRRFNVFFSIGQTF
jgi:outer membrane protein insertion porin family